MVATEKGFTAGGEETALRFDDPELTFIFPLSCQAAAQLSPPAPTERLPTVGGLAAPEVEAADMWPPMGWTGELPNKLTPVLGVLDEAIVGATASEHGRKTLICFLTLTGT